MQKRYIQAFGCIRSFVDDLWELFGDEKSPLPINLYRRLLRNVNEDDVEIVNYFLSGFRYFLQTYEEQILEGRLTDIPKGVRINYKDSNKVYLDIQKYIYKSDPETRDVIRQHLLTISTILDPNSNKMEKLDNSGIEDLGIDESTPEGKLFGDIMHRTRDAMSSFGEEDTMNPTIAFISLAQSGFLTDLMGDFQQRAESGEIDIQKLFGTMQSMMTSAAQGLNQSAIVEEEDDDYESSGDVIVDASLDDSSMSIQSVQSSDSDDEKCKLPTLSSIKEESLDFSDFPSEEDID